jgi:hypothetical protein
MLKDWMELLAAVAMGLAAKRKRRRSSGVGGVRVWVGTELATSCPNYTPGLWNA